MRKYIVLLLLFACVFLALMVSRGARVVPPPNEHGPIDESTVVDYLKHQERLPKDWPAAVVHERGVFYVTLVIPVTPGGPDHRGQYVVAEDGKILARFGAGRMVSLDEALEYVRQQGVVLPKEPIGEDKKQANAERRKE